MAESDYVPHAYTKLYRKDRYFCLTFDYKLEDIDGISYLSGLLKSQGIDFVDMERVSESTLVFPDYRDLSWWNDLLNKYSKKGDRYRYSINIIEPEDCNDSNTPPLSDSNATNDFRTSWRDEAIREYDSDKSS